jgi:hypothetical protein
MARLVRPLSERGAEPAGQLRDNGAAASGNGLGVGHACNGCVTRSKLAA